MTRRTITESSLDSAGNKKMSKSQTRLLSTNFNTDKWKQFNVIEEVDEEREIGRKGRRTVKAVKGKGLAT